MSVMRISLMSVLVVHSLVGTVVNAKEVDMSKDFRIVLGERSFSIVAPIPPDNEFVTYHRSLPIHDDVIFKESKRVVGLNVHWTYRSGLLRRVAGVIELEVFIQSAETGGDVSSSEGLRKDILSDFRKELRKVGYRGESVLFDELEIDGRSWLVYRVPILGVTEYSTSLTDSRYLTVQFSFIDNTGDKAPEWRREAGNLMMSLVKSMRVE